MHMDSANKTSANKTIDTDFRSKINELIEQRKSVRIQYYTDINEFISITALIKTLYQKEAVSYITLSNGEEIGLDKVVRIGDLPAPGYDKDYFACDI